MLLNHFIQFILCSNPLPTYMYCVLLELYRFESQTKFNTTVQWTYSVCGCQAGPWASDVSPWMWGVCDLENANCDPQEFFCEHPPPLPHWNRISPPLPGSNCGLLSRFSLWMPPCFLLPPQLSDMLQGSVKIDLKLVVWWLYQERLHQLFLNDIFLTNEL
jgi:hypothetical protein